MKMNRMRGKEELKSACTAPEKKKKLRDENV